jgi:hypothetical protein
LQPDSPINLGRTITAYGYDPEEQASRRSCGLPYVPEAEREEWIVDILFSRPQEHEAT